MYQETTVFNKSTHSHGKAQGKQLPKVHSQPVDANEICCPPERQSKPSQLNEKDTVSQYLAIFALASIPIWGFSPAEPGHQEKPKSGRKISSRFTMALQQPGACFGVTLG